MFVRSTLEYAFAVIVSNYLYKTPNAVPLALCGGPALQGHYQFVEVVLFNI